MTFFKWSQTAASNGSADSTCPFPEGMSPAALNDGTRGMMAALAKYRDDTAGTGRLTGGTSTAYTIASYQGFTTLAGLTNQEICIIVNATNGDNPTLNVDGLGALPIHSTIGGSALPAGTLIALTPYSVVLNGTTDFILKGFYGSPYVVPLGGMIDYFGTSAPSSNFVFPFGQAISRTTYATLFSLLGTTYGAGDGTTTFNIPDVRGRVIAGKDDMGGSAAGRIGSVATDSGTIVGTTLGSGGGSSTHALSLGELPTGITTTGTVTVTVPGSLNVPMAQAISDISFTPSGGGRHVPEASGSNWSGTASLSGTNTLTSNNTSGAAHAILQHTIIGNKLLRII